MVINGQQKTQEIKISGLVQGVGFRPFIYRLATRIGLKGWVENRNDAVHILVRGTEEEIGRFVEEVRNEKPAISYLDEITITDSESLELREFKIQWSKSEGDAVTEVSPDIAVCDDCLDDMKRQPHRLDYPFTNCTNCGPRFSIIRSLPYDRNNTTMSDFRMCGECEAEYEDLKDRRFHAQPVACNHCGPAYRLVEKNSSLSDISKITDRFAEIIHHDGVIIAKGLGGFFLACDALNETAVRKLRSLKRRYTKPFAVMFRDIDSLKGYAQVSTAEERELSSWQRPVLILEERRPLAASVSRGFPTVGAMLPYLPFHYLLFEKLNTPALVFTSGNFSEEPILIDDNKTLEEFGGKLEAVLVNNRPIHNRVDDSVGFVVNGSFRLIRRSRGYVPSPVFMKRNVEGLVAAGAELVNCFCVGKDTRAILSQHIGDLKNFETLEFYEESFNRFMDLFRIKARAVACDMHPDYLSTRYARSLGIPVLAVQHHHAHIASCMAENGLDEKVIGISMDGTGLGTDGNIWGSEFMVCDLQDFERITHFGYKPMPGGDLAVAQPWRMALSYLDGIEGLDPADVPLIFREKISAEEIGLVLQSMKQGINSPLSSGAGRLFDAVAAILGVIRVSGFHAEAPMRLESIAADNEKGCYDYDYADTICFDNMLLAILDDLEKGITIPVISARFHNTIINVITRLAEIISGNTGIKNVVLSGGIFQNRYILARVENRFKELDFNCYSHRLIPSNDGGIALGQLAVLSKNKDYVS